MILRGNIATREESGQYVAHYNLCRVHEALRITPAMQLQASNHVWSIAELIDAALASEPETPKPIIVRGARRYGHLRVIDGGKV